MEDDAYEFNPDLVISHFDNTDIKHTRTSEQLVPSVFKEMAELLDIEYNVNTTPIHKPLAAYSFGLNESGIDDIYIWTANTVRSAVIDAILQSLDDKNVNHTHTHKLHGYSQVFMITLLLVLVFLDYHKWNSLIIMYQQQQNY